MSNIVYNPIYIWSQSLDNQSDDDFYCIENGKASMVQNLERSQNIVSQMGDVNINGKDLTYFLKNLPYFEKTGIASISYDSSHQKFLISYNSKDRDNVGRSSTIDVLIDVSGLHQQDYKGYVENFYNGFIDFCQKTNRHHTIEDLDKINTLVDVLTNGLSEEDKTVGGVKENKKIH